MKIAVPVTANNQVDSHFGHCEFYNIFTVNNNNEIEKVQSLKSEQGCGCKSNIAGVLAQSGVTVMLAGGIGGGAINVLNSVGIEVIRGCAGKPDEVVKAYLAGSITDSGISCSHHEDHHATDVCNHK
jgi:predicted Fe-Mo cluster-binding NifX family protein